MNLAIVILLFVLGIAIIVKGGDLFVDAASWIAEVSGIPKLIVGATVVSLATTLPEMIVSCIAAAQGKVDMAIGNAVGSVTANTGLIMAISLVFIPMVINRKKYLPKSVMLLAAIAALLVCSLSGELTVARSLVLFVIFGLFIFENVREAVRGDSGSKSERPAITRKGVVTNIVKFVIGAAGIVIGSNLLVDNGSALAGMLGVPESIIALTCVAIGTSLPELVTTITAVVKKEASLSVGNVIGANIIDITLILPICSMISGGSLPVSAQTLALDLPVCLGIAAVALIPALICGKFHRWQGALCLIAYGAYLAVICF